MNKIKARLNKMASNVEKDLKELCVEKILKDNNVSLAEMSVADLVDYLEMSETLTFENIEDLVSDWIADTQLNFPEQLR